MAENRRREVAGKDFQFGEISTRLTARGEQPRFWLMWSAID